MLVASALQHFIGDDGNRIGTLGPFLDNAAGDINPFPANINDHFLNGGAIYDSGYPSGGNAQNPYGKSEWVRMYPDLPDHNAMIDFILRIKSLNLSGTYQGQQYYLRINYPDDPTIPQQRLWLITRYYLYGTTPAWGQDHPWAANWVWKNPGTTEKTGYYAWIRPEFSVYREPRIITISASGPTIPSSNFPRPSYSFGYY